jgi:hypothetical protein
MARLPIPGGDVDAWAGILNEFLLVAHNPDGTPRTHVAGAPATPYVGLSDLQTTNPAGSSIKDLILSNDGTDLVWRKNTVISVRDYGAVGDGITDDTAAVQAAIDTATTGGGIIFSRGIYKVSGLKIKAHGVTLTGTARRGVRISRLANSGSGPLIDVSGTASLDSHIKYCSLENLTIDGDYKPGTLLRSYYADNLIFREVNFVHAQGNATDFVEVWDTSFEDCIWEDCGSVTEPAMLLRNSTPPGTFGFSNDNTNQIHFHSCRWEGFRNGAVRLDGAANGSPNLLNGIFFLACKMETRFVAGSAFQIMDGTSIVFVSQFYMAMMARDVGFTTPVDAIEDHGTQVFMTDVYVQWGAEIGLANSILHIYRGSPHTYHKISSYFPTEDPATGCLVVDPAATLVMLTSLWTNRGKKIVGDTTSMIVGGPTFGYVFPLDGTGLFRVSSLTTGKDLVKVDNDPVRQALEIVNSADTMGFSDNYITEKWRIVGASGAAKFAGGKFQVEGTKGYIGMNATPFTNISMLIRPAVEGDRGLAIVRPSSTATNRLMEFQDETFNIQGLSIDSNGRPVAVGTPPKVTAGTQVSYANPGLQVRDIAGNISVAVRPSPTAPGTIATVTFSRAYASAPLNIAINDHSAIAANLYVSARTTTSFTVSTRNALQGGSILNFDYSVIA